MARSTLCIDTDILIDFLRDRGRYASIFEQALERFPCVLASVTVYEIAFGIERYGRHGDRARFQHVLRVVGILPFDLAAARTSAKLDAALHRAGTRIELPDLLIAGICVAKQATLLTGNRAHFARIPRLKLLDPERFLKEAAKPDD